MSIVKTVEDYLSDITSEHADKPLFVAYARALLQPLVDSQSLLRELLDTFDLDTAVGVQLDATGQWIGRTRFVSTPLSGIYFSFDTVGVGFDQGSWQGPFDPTNGLTRLDDATYRLLLKAKRTLNNWDGSIPMAADALAEIMPASQGSIVTIQDNQDMTMTVGIAGQVPPAIVLSLLQGGYLPINPSGVGVNYAITSINNQPIFGFDVNSATVAGFDIGAWSGIPGVGPSAPPNFAVVTFSDTSVTLSWTAPETGTGPYTYQLQVQLGDGTQGVWALYGLPTSTTQMTATGLSPGALYAFSVYAINSIGPGAQSVTVTQRTQSATNYNASALDNVMVMRVSSFIAVTASFNLASGVATLPPIVASGLLIRPDINVAIGRATLLGP